MWIQDPKTKQRSVTLTFYVFGFVVALTKLILSGLIVGGLQMGVFGGGDFAAVVAALGSIYAARKYTDKDAVQEIK